MADPRILSWATEQVRLVLSRYHQDESSLLAFMFHALVKGPRIPSHSPVHPSQCHTTGQLYDLVEYFLDAGYQFVGPEDILAGLNPYQNHVLLTFDDGYFNNSLALPILEEFHVPALFFISTTHVSAGKAYWPDVVYRRRTAAGSSPSAISEELAALKELPPQRIEARLKSEFGANALVPRGDDDRPFRADELARFAEHPLVRIGNHTQNHAILTKVAADEARRQIIGAQEDLERLCRQRPTTIAYPNGNYSPAVIESAAAAGLKLGFTVEKAKMALPLSTQPEDLLTLGRLSLRNDRPLKRQSQIFRGRFKRRKPRPAPAYAA